MKIHIYDTYNDWQFVYVDGNLFYEGHEMDTDGWLALLEKISCVELTHEYSNEVDGLPKLIEETRGKVGAVTHAEFRHKLEQATLKQLEQERDEVAKKIEYLEAQMLLAEKRMAKLQSGNEEAS